MPSSPDLLWTEVRPLLDAALDLDPDARLAYLDQACADRPRLRAEVEAFLALEDEAAGLDESVADLARPLLEALDAPGADPLVQTRVGAYRIQAQVGRGGMGTVYRAHRDDGLFESVVALKVVRRGLDTEDVLARFASERRILGRLAHPAIARLLDGGALDDGRPWLAMEFVEGVPLTEWAEARELSVHDRVALVLQVVRAVAFAHQRLVVHRDLKPSNVLVLEGPDGEAQVKLLDFGIARVLEGDEDTVHTRTGRVGAHTPAYAAPEQQDGRPVTTATDVYQLGLLLTEVLTGIRSPAGEAIVPSALASTPEAARAIRGDLDTLVAVACADEPDARYATAAALAADLERFLDGHALAARPPGRWERAIKFVRRHPAGVAAGATITALVVLASGLAAAFAVTTVRQSAEVATQRDRAEATVEFMSGLFQEANPYVGRGDSVTAGEMLRLGEERLRSSLAEEPVARAALLHTLGSI
ncbi:MAG: serine/threonine-protein kinase, partial [Bacteroidota bacterium]